MPWPPLPLPPTTLPLPPMELGGFLRPMLPARSLIVPPPRTALDLATWPCDGEEESIDAEASCWLAAKGGLESMGAATTLL